VAPLTHVVEVKNALRPDEVGPTPPREQVLAGAPDTEGPYLRVPGVVDKDLPAAAAQDSQEGGDAR